MQMEVLTYEADGLLMQSHLYFEDGPSPRPGILVFPEALGLSQHAKTQAQRLAALGYIALACDLHGEGKVFEDLKSAAPLLEGLRKEPAHTRARAKGGLDALVARPEVDPSRVAAIGLIGGWNSTEVWCTVSQNPAFDEAGRTQVSRYDAKAATRSWATMRAFLEDIFA